MIRCSPYRPRQLFLAADGAASVQAPAQEPTDPGREEQTLREMLAYFSTKQSQYDEYDRVCNALYRSPSGPRAARLVWGIILSAFLLQIWIVLMLAMSRASPTKYILIVNTILLLLAAPSVVMIVTYAVRSRTHRRCDRRFGELTRELNQHYAEFGPCPVSFAYSNPAVLGALLAEVRSGRANSAEEAIKQLWGEAYVRDREALLMQNVLSAQAAARGVDTPAAFSAAAFIRNSHRDL